MNIYKSTSNWECGILLIAASSLEEAVTIVNEYTSSPAMYGIGNCYTTEIIEGASYDDKLGSGIIEDCIGGGAANLPFE